MTLRRKIKDGYWSKKKTQISRLPMNILFEILNKLNNNELIRMRKTCSFVHLAVKSYERKLASRPTLGISLKICDDEEINLQLGSYYTTVVGKFAKGLHMQTSNTRFTRGNFEKFSFSGISFDSITVNIRSRDRELFHHLLKILEKLQPVCNEFVLSYCPWDLVVPITNCVTSKKDLDVTKIFNYKEKFDWDMDMALSHISSLKKARNCSKFIARIPGNVKIDGILEKVRYFVEVYLGTNEKGFKELLFDIQNSKEKIGIKLISLDLEDSDEYCPPIERFVSHFPVIGMPFGIVTKQFVPSEVRLIKLPSQYVFICESGRTLIYFADKCASSVEDALMSIYADHREHEQFKNDAYDEEEFDEEKYEYYEDDNDEHLDHEKVEPRIRYNILRRSVRSLATSILQ